MKPNNIRSRSVSPSIRAPSEHIPLDSFPSSANDSNSFQRVVNQIIEICYRVRVPLLERQRYRYFSLLILILAGLALLQGFFLWESNQLVLEKKTFKPMSYLGLDPNVPGKLPNRTTIYHVSKEFGPATLGAIGQMVTGLAQAQAKNGSFDVNVIMPFYSYIKTIFRCPKFAQLELQIRDDYGKWQPVKFFAHKFLWNITDSHDVTSANPSEIRSIQVYLIGRPNLNSFTSAFTAKDVTEIYSSPYPLSKDLEDLYFCKAVAELITYLNTNVDTPLFSLIDSRSVDIVHIHGASNALAIEFMKSLYVGGEFKSPQPTTVYTLHDYAEEHLYSNAVVNVEKFMDLRNYTEANPHYFNKRRMYMSVIAIDQAQIVTFVSEVIAQKMVEGSFDFYAKELIMPSILKRAAKGEWIGITSGFDLVRFNPFNDTMLIETNSKFPGNVYDFNINLLYAEAPKNSTQSLLTQSKFNAKFHLIREGLLSNEDLNRTIVLFIGNFRYDKGLEFFQAAADLLASRNAKFIIMGKNNDYPITLLNELTIRYPGNVIIIDDIEFQMTWGSLYRAAADILFVPSKTESFELIEVEGLLFGCPIVSTGVGELKIFLVNKTSNDTIDGYNSYLFNLIDEKNVELSINEMKVALSNSLDDLIRLNNNLIEKEIFIRNLVKGALKLGWDRDGGPFEKYVRVYRMALLKLRKDIDEVEKPLFIE